MKVSIAVAVSENGCIGSDGRLPWHYKEDLDWFRHLTMGNPIIMGRKTFESIGKKPLKGRRNVVLTSDPEMAHYGVTVVSQPFTSTILQAANQDEEARECFVIGGSAVYSLMMPVVNTMYVTKIPQKYDGDTFFESWPISEDAWLGHQLHWPSENNLEFWRYDRRVKY